MQVMIFEIRIPPIRPSILNTWYSPTCRGLLV